MPRFVTGRQARASSQGVQLAAHRLREKRSKLSRPPCKGETGQRSDDEREQTAGTAGCHRERASQLGRGRGSYRCRLLRLAAGGEHPVTDDDEEDADVKPARTTSGGRAALLP